MVTNTIVFCCECYENEIIPDRYVSILREYSVFLTEEIANWKFESEKIRLHLSLVNVDCVKSTCPWCGALWVPKEGYDSSSADINVGCVHMISPYISSQATIIAARTNYL